jgi:SRSO17 transposase
MATEIECPGIDEYMEPFMGYFHRSESRELAECYVTGLLMDGERKSVEPMSERVNASERSMQRLLSDVKWDDQGVLATYRARMLAATADPRGICVFDDTGFPKKGQDSVCVSRQYCGATGKTDNCQVGVSMTYVGRDVAWPFGMKLFVPESWDKADDADCQALRKKTKMPESATYRPKWRIALELLDEATAAQVPHWAVIADGWYGDIPEFREELVSRGKQYLLGVYADTQVFLESPTFEAAPPSERKRGRPRQRPKIIVTNSEPVKVSAVGASVAADAWQRLELRPDSRDKPLVVEAVALRVWPAHGWRHGAVHEAVWLLIERRRLSKGGVELRYFFSNMPQTLPTIDLARLNHERYWIEHGYQQLKEELGLDHHEGRSWPGWHRHVLLTFLAYGYLTLIRLREKKQQNQRAWSAWHQTHGILEKECFWWT